MLKSDAKYVKGYYLRTKIRKIAVYVIQIGLAILLAFLCAYLFCQRITVSEASMEPTLSEKDKVLINVLSYKLSSPKRGDIIVYKYGNTKNEQLEIKRVIGLPGDTVVIQDGKIIINNETYIEKNNFAPIENPGIASTPITLEADEYFVLGDNRNNSQDSRYADVGAITRKNIMGKLWLRYGPMDRMGMVK